MLYVYALWHAFDVVDTVVIKKIVRNRRKNNLNLWYVDDDKNSWDDDDDVDFICVSSSLTRPTFWGRRIKRSLFLIIGARRFQVLNL